LCVRDSLPLILLNVNEAEKIGIIINISESIDNLSINLEISTKDPINSYLHGCSIHSLLGVIDIDNIYPVFYFQKFLSVVDHNNHLEHLLGVNKGHEFILSLFFYEDCQSMGMNRGHYQIVIPNSK
jgi:hypothetical protein